jgi:hypothetical protein
VEEGKFLRNPNDPRDKNTPDPPQPKDEIRAKVRQALKNVAGAQLGNPRAVEAARTSAVRFAANVLPSIERLSIHYFELRSRLREKSIDRRFRHHSSTVGPRQLLI